MTVPQEGPEFNLNDSVVNFIKGTVSVEKTPSERKSQYLTHSE